MKASWRIGLAVTAAVASAAAFAVLFPHARDAGTILLAQDDPVALSDLQVGSALRNNPSVVTDNVGQALDANDADLAKSFTDLATDRAVPVAADVATRVDAAVVEENSKFHSKPLDTGEKFTMTFADAAEIKYFCGLHPHMTGKIIVKP